MPRGRAPRHRNAEAWYDLSSVYHWLGNRKAVFECHERLVGLPRLVLKAGTRVYEAQTQCVSVRQPAKGFEA